MAAKIRKQDQGTAYAAALVREHGNIRNCDDAAAMAGFLEGNAQRLLGAVSPRLMWEGAQHASLTNYEMAALMLHSPAVALDLMWIDTGRPLPARVAAQVRRAVEEALAPAVMPPHCRARLEARSDCPDCERERMTR